MLTRPFSSATHIDRTNSKSLIREELLDKSQSKNITTTPLCICFAAPKDINTFLVGRYSHNSSILTPCSAHDDSDTTPTFLCTRYSVRTYINWSPCPCPPSLAQSSPKITHNSHKTHMTMIHIHSFHVFGGIYIYWVSVLLWENPSTLRRPIKSLEGDGKSYTIYVFKSRRRLTHASKLM